MINVKVELLETSQAIDIEAKNTYTKGRLFCVYGADGKVQKFPVENIFRVTEDYSEDD